MRFYGPPPSLRLFIWCTSSTTAGPPIHHSWEVPSCNDPVHISSTIFSTASAPPLGSGVVTPSQQVFFSSPFVLLSNDQAHRKQNGVNSTEHTHGCMCNPRLQTRSAHTPTDANTERVNPADASKERAHPRMRTRNLQWAAHPWMSRLLVYFRLPSSSLLPFLHWSDLRPAGPSLLLCRFDVSSVDPVHLYSCVLLSFVPVHLTCRTVSTSLTPSVHLTHRPCCSSSHKWPET